MNSHLVRLSGMAGDVMGIREAVAPPRQLHTLTLVRKLECVVQNEKDSGRSDWQDAAGALLACFVSVYTEMKHPSVSWAEHEKRGIAHLQRGLSFMRQEFEERRANG